MSRLNRRITSAHPTRSAIVAILFITVIPVPYAPAQDGKIATEDAKLLAEIRDHNELMANAEHLSDVIGPRLTGSAAQRSASDWAQQQFQKYGLVNIHQEVWTISHSWTRGSAEASIVSPITRRLAVASAGWTPGTDGVVQGPVVHVAAASAADLDRYRGKLAGAIVVLDQPQPVTPPYAWGHPPVQFELQAPYVEAPDGESSAGPFDKTRLKFLQTEGVRAILRDSEKPYNLLDMANGSAGDHQPGLVPTAYVSHEDYALIWRLFAAGRGTHATVALELVQPGTCEDFQHGRRDSRRREAGRSRDLGRTHRFLGFGLRIDRQRDRRRDCA